MPRPLYLICGMLKTKDAIGYFLPFRGLARHVTTLAIPGEAASLGQALGLLGARERAGEPVSLHVNLSGATVSDLSVLEFIERLLDEGEADPARCTFEITQTARVEDYDTAAYGDGDTGGSDDWA